MIDWLLSRLTPVRLRVVYGPNRGGGDHAPELIGAYAWQCNTTVCVEAEPWTAGGYCWNLATAKAAAHAHARSHHIGRAYWYAG